IFRKFNAERPFPHSPCHCEGGTVARGRSCTCSLTTAVRCTSGNVQLLWTRQLPPAARSREHSVSAASRVSAAILMRCQIAALPMVVRTTSGSRPPEDCLIFLLQLRVSGKRVALQTIADELHRPSGAWRRRRARGRRRGFCRELRRPDT